MPWRLLIQFPNWLVNAGKIMLDVFDGQKLTILTCNWLVLGWGSRMLKTAFGHYRLIWVFPRNLRELGFLQTPWESQGVFYNIFAGLIQVLIKYWSWILALIPVSQSPSCSFIPCPSHSHWPRATPSPLFGAVEGEDVPARLLAKCFSKNASPHPSQDVSPEKNVTFLNRATVLRSGKKSI